MRRLRSERGTPASLRSERDAHPRLRSPTPDARGSFWAGCSLSRRLLGRVGTRPNASGGGPATNACRVQLRAAAGCAEGPAARPHARSAGSPRRGAEGAALI